MATAMVFHEVNDVEHRIASPKREGVFGPRGATIRALVETEKTNRVGLIAQVPDMNTLHEVVASDVAADEMKFDGVRPDTMVMLVEGCPHRFSQTCHVSESVRLVTRDRPQAQPGWGRLRVGRTLAVHAHRRPVAQRPRLSGDRWCARAQRHVLRS